MLTCVYIKKRKTGIKKAILGKTFTKFKKKKKPQTSVLCLRSTSVLPVWPPTSGKGHPLVVTAKLDAIKGLRAKKKSRFILCLHKQTQLLNQHWLKHPGAYRTVVCQFTLFCFEPFEHNKETGASSGGRKERREGGGWTRAGRAQYVDPSLSPVSEMNTCCRWAFKRKTLKFQVVCNATKE